jgi:hypothetical protein
MGQVNVNTPSGGEPAGSSGAGFILGIIVAIIVIAALVYFLVLGGGNNNGGTTDPGTDGGTDGGTDTGGEASDGEEVAPSSWRLVDLA